MTQYGRKNDFCLSHHDKLPEYSDEGGFWRLLCGFQTNAGVRNRNSILVQCTEYSLLYGTYNGTPHIYHSPYFLSDHPPPAILATLIICFSFPKVFIISLILVPFSHTQSDTIVRPFVGCSFCQPMGHVC